MHMNQHWQQVVRLSFSPLEAAVLSSVQQCSGQGCVGTWSPLTTDVPSTAEARHGRALRLLAPRPRGRGILHPQLLPAPGGGGGALAQHQHHGARQGAARGQQRYRGSGKLRLSIHFSRRRR